MEASTPISGHREPMLINMGDDSPINGENSDRSGSTEGSLDVIPSSKVKAGLSDDINIMAVTPQKEFSPDTMDKKLALHCIDIVNASTQNAGLVELRELDPHILPLSENSFAGKTVEAQPNEVPEQVTYQEELQTGGVVGINKPYPMEDAGDLTIDKNGAVGMDEMNKSPIGGVGIIWRLWEVWMGLRERR